jgi:ABC-type phosphonate transport system ATPase subunit
MGLAAIVVTHDLAVARLLSAPHDRHEGRARRRVTVSPTACSTIRARPTRSCLVSSILQV